jgi:hypothetical protein
MTPWQRRAASLSHPRTTLFANAAHLAERFSVANAKVTIESLIAEAEAARAKAMSEKGGAAAAVSALTAKAKLAGLWREKVDQHTTGSPVIERIERVIVDHRRQSNHVTASLSEPRNEPEHKISYEETAAVSKPPRHWSE